MGLSSDMERRLLKVIALLSCLLILASGRIEENAAKQPRKRHLFVQRDKPLPGSLKKLFKIEHEEPSRSSGDQKAHEFFRRVRRSLNPNMIPEASLVRLVAIFLICTLKFYGKCAVQTCFFKATLKLNDVYELFRYYNSTY